ncbi:MAG: ANTAR domain-containing protein [Phascolarctobacterium sp.]|nr:ANTAR domain-containing protein [Phascolarctobacterium sp.]
MSFKEHTYNVLILSASESFNAILDNILPQGIYPEKHFFSSFANASKALESKSYDFIIVNTTAQADAGIRFALNASKTNSSIVLLLVKSEDYDETYDKVADHGIFLLGKPLGKQTLLATISCMASAKERMRTLTNKVHLAEEQAAEIRLTNRAKWLLIDKEGMTEQDAHRFIEKQAMDSCSPRKKIALEIINRYI